MNSGVDTFPYVVVVDDEMMIIVCVFIKNGEFYENAGFIRYCQHCGLSIILLKKNKKWDYAGKSKLCFYVLNPDGENFLQLIRKLNNERIINGYTCS